MKTPFDVLDAINTLERHFPVASWHTHDIDLWPTYRFRLYGNGIDRILLNAKPQSSLARLRKLADRAWRASWRVPLAAMRDRGGNATLSSDTAAVFLSDGVSFVRMGNACVDRVVDPVMEALAGRGQRSLKLTPLAEAHIPRYMPSLFIQPAIDLIKLTAARRRREMVLPEFDALYAAARAAFGNGAPSLKWLHVQANRLDALARWFGRVLERSGASHAFVNTYYSLEGLAFVQAARRLGLRSIDLQHGIQGAHHVGYARWVGPPATGYSTLPDEFWVWGWEEASVIESWRSACATHGARVTGNFWLQRWCDNTDTLVAAYVAQALALRGPPPAITQALVCLTWGVAEEETDKVIEAAKLCGPSVAWWWRLHPVQSSRSAEFSRRLERNGLDGRVVGQATHFPLYALIRVADLVVAHSSTVIREAAEVGVPSVVTSDYGAEMHAGLVRQGQVVRATDARTIADAVMRLAVRPRPDATVMEAERGLLQAAVDATFPNTRAHSSRKDATFA